MKKKKKDQDAGEIIHPEAQFPVKIRTIIILFPKSRELLLFLNYNK